jgi:hypothetical protein
VILAADVIRSDGTSHGVNVLKISDSGEITWAVTLKKNNFSLQLISVGNQGYLLAGKVKDPMALVLVSLKADGSLRSEVAYTLTPPNFRVASLAITPDQGVAISGSLIKKGGSHDGFFLKIDDRQTVILHKRLGFHKNPESIASVIPNKDGSYLLFGNSGSRRGPNFEYITDTLFATLNGDGFVSGCSFSNDLSVSKIRVGTVHHQNLKIDASLLSLPTQVRGSR